MLSRLLNTKTLLVGTTVACGAGIYYHNSTDHSKKSLEKLEEDFNQSRTKIYTLKPLVLGDGPESKNN